MKEESVTKKVFLSSAAAMGDAVALQIANAKAQQKADAARRVAEGQGYKSPSAVATTTPQSEVTNKPPVLYTPPKINVPNSFWEMARLMDIELNKVATSQSYLLTLWKKLKSQHVDSNGLTIDSPVTITGSLTVNGAPLPTWRFEQTYEYNAVPWNVKTGLYNERNVTDTSSCMIVHFYGGGGSSSPSVQFRVSYKNGGLWYRSARDGYGFELEFERIVTESMLTDTMAAQAKDIAELKEQIRQLQQR